MTNFIERDVADMFNGRKRLDVKDIKRSEGLQKKLDKITVMLSENGMSLSANYEKIPEEYNIVTPTPAALEDVAKAMEAKKKYEAKAKKPEAKPEAKTEAKKPEAKTEAKTEAKKAIMVFTYSMLYDAWKKTVVQSSNEPNRAKYKYYLEDHIHYIISSIEDMTFTPKPMRNKTIYFPKKRNVQVPTIDDKIVQHAICDNYLYERVTKPLIKETSACLIGRGDGYASKIMTGNLRRYYAQNGSEFYALKCDIHHYFATIDHEKIVPLIERYVDDEVVKWRNQPYANAIYIERLVIS